MTIHHWRGGIRAVLLGATLAISACGLFVDEEALLSRAQEAQQRGDLRAASIDLKSLLQKNANHKEARVLLGEVELGAGNVPTAIREFERARAAGVPEGRIREPLVRAHLALREFDRALELLNKGIDEAKAANDSASLARLTQLRGETYLAKREFAPARDDFAAALALAPQEIRAMLGLVSVAEATDGPDAALAALDPALKAAPNDPLVHLARGGLLLQKRQWADASTAFQAGVEQAADPAHKNEQLSALGGLAQAQLGQGDIATALKTTERMQQLAPNSPLMRYTRAYALAQNNELTKARELLEQNVAQTNDLRSQMLLGAVNLTEGRYGQAEMLLSAVVSAAPDNAEARQLLAQARLRQAKAADALDALLPALEEDKNASAQLLALAGQASLAAGRTQEGVALLKRNLANHPSDPKAQLDLAAGYLAAGQADQALALLEGKSGERPAEQGEEQIVRREYLAVLAQLQKNDVNGAIARATQAAQQHSKNASMQMLAGAVLMRQRQFDRARPYVEAVVQLEPNQAAGYTNLGRLELLQGNVDAAREHYRKALQKQPGDALAGTSLALLETSLRRTDAALEVLGQVRKHNPDSIEPRVLEGQLLLGRGKLDDAEKLARETVEKAGDHAGALALLGRVLSTEGRHAEALTSFERAVRAQPKSAPIHYQLAVAQRAAGKLDDALKSNRQALQLDDKYLPAKLLDGQLNVAKGDLDAASRQADSLLKVAPDQAGTHELIGYLRVAQKRFDDGARAFRKAGELSAQPQFAVAEFEARSKGKLPNPEEPLELYLKAHPADVLTRLTLGMAQQARGDRAAAARSYEQVLSNSPKHAIALNNLAWLRHEEGKSDAVDLARRAYESAPDALAVVDTYAWILTNNGRAKDAVKLLEPLVAAARSDAPLRPDIRAHYAVALARAGRQAEAKTLAKDLTMTHGNGLEADMRSLLADILKT